MKRDEFLARVKSAAEAGRAFRVASVELPDEVGYVGASGDLCVAFAREVVAVGGEAELVDDADGAREALGRLLDRYRPQSAIGWRHELLERMGVQDELRRRAIAWHDFDSLTGLPEDERRSTSLAAGIGITSCDFAIAETGSLVMCSQPGRERIASLLPPVHVAILSRQQIVPDLIDVVGALGRREFDGLPSNVTLITGPSKTGDIELQLTTGVHGPGYWHVVIIRQPS